MAISLRLNEEDIKLFKSYAKLKKVSLSELFRSAVMEQIEDDYDLKTYDNAMRKFRENTNTHTLCEVEKELGLVYCIAFCFIYRTQKQCI